MTPDRCRLPRSNPPSLDHRGHRDARCHYLTERLSSIHAAQRIMRAIADTTFRYQTRRKPVKVISRISLGLLIALMFSGFLMAAPCETLMSMKFPDAKVTLAQNVAAGAFVPPGANPQAAAASMRRRTSSASRRKRH